MFCIGALQTLISMLSLLCGTQASRLPAEVAAAEVQMQVLRKEAVVVFRYLWRGDLTWSCAQNIMLPPQDSGEPGQTWSRVVVRIWNH